jgi:hypothetical protein
MCVNVHIFSATDCVHSLLAGADVSSGRENHLNKSHKENRRQSDRSRHGRVVFRPKGGQTWVAKRYECGRQEVDKGGRD